MGASFDTPEDNEAWAEEEGFAFDLWSDTDRTLAVYYGAAKNTSQAYADRDTFILDENGVLVLQYENTSPSSGPQDTLEDCQALFGG